MQYDLPLLKLAHELGCELTNAAAQLAIRCCYTDSLEYLCEHGCIGDDTSVMSVVCSPNDNTQQALRILHEHGHPLNDPAMCAAAARKDLMDCLQYLHEAGCPWDVETCKGAVEYGDPDCLAYVHERGCPWVETVRTPTLPLSVFPYA